jgi:hypothetical protein
LKKVSGKLQMMSLGYIKSLIVLTLIFFSTSYSIHSYASVYEIDSNLENFDYLIITPRKFISSIKPLALWKQQRGLETRIISTESIKNKFDGNNLEEQIRNGIAHYDTSNNITWVLLLGNENHIPAVKLKIQNFENEMYNYAYSDIFYSEVSSNYLFNLLDKDNSDTVYPSLPIEWDPEVYIGRLPVDSKEEVVELVTQQLQYEQSPPQGGWMNKIVLAGDYIHFNEDRNGDSVTSLYNNERSDYDQNRYHHWLNKTFFPSNYSTIFLGETEGVCPTQFHYDYSFNKENLVNILNQGVLFGNIGAHGGPAEYLNQHWFAIDYDKDTIFDIGTDERGSKICLDTDTDLQSNGKEGFFYLESCTLGDFVNGNPSLAKYLLMHNAIGIIASTGVSYTHFGWNENDSSSGKCWLNAGLSSRFWKYLFSNATQQPGKALELARKDYINTKNTISPPNWIQEERHFIILHEFNLFGDPEIPLWLTNPRVLNVTVDSSVTKTNLTIYSDNKPIEETTVTVMNNSYFWKGLTDVNGQLELPIVKDSLNEYDVIVSKSGYFPYQLESNIGISDFSKLYLENEKTPTHEWITPFLFISAVGILVTSLIAIRKKKIT